MCGVMEKAVTDDSFFLIQWNRKGVIFQAEIER